MLRYLFLFLLLIAPAAAQQPPKPVPTPNPQLPKPEPEVKKPKKLPTVREHWEVQPKDQTRPTKHILFLFDSSGSMKEDQIGTAIEFVLNNRTGVAAAPFDDFYIALATFGSKVARWEGSLDIDPETKKPISPYGWAAMPSEDNLRKGRSWISSHLDGGGTDFTLGIQHCFDSCNGHDPKDKTLLLAGLKQAVTIENLTILVLTDGDFDSDVVTYKRIAELQKQRASKKLSEAIIGFVGIKVQLPTKAGDTTGHTTLIEFAKKYAKLGYLRLEFIAEKPEAKNSK